MENITIIPFLNKFNRLILNPIILLGFTLAFLFFIYSVVRFLSMDKSANKDRIEARNAIMWSIVGMVVMFSVYGLIKFVLATFGISNSDVPATASQFLGF